MGLDLCFAAERLRGIRLSSNTGFSHTTPKKL